MNLEKFRIVLDNYKFRFPFILASGFSIWFSISNSYGIINIGLIPLIFSFLFVTTLSIQEIVIKAVYYMIKQYKLTEWYWSRYFTDWQLDFLMECITTHYISTDEFNDYSESIIDSITRLEKLEVIKWEFQDIFSRHVMTIHYALPAQFNMIEPYLKNRLIKKNVKTDTK